MNSEKRARALARLAASHRIDPKDQNPSGGRLAGYLERPDSICGWVLVMSRPEFREVELHADFSDHVEAFGNANERDEDPICEEGVIEIVHLDSGDVYRRSTSSGWAVDHRLN